MRKIKLADLADQIDWISIQNEKRPREGMKPDEIQVSFKENKKHPGKIDLVKIRIGHQVMANMGWSIKDKICVYHHPDDYMALRLLKTEAGSGYKLRPEYNSLHGCIEFKWGLDMLLPALGLTSVKFITPRDEYIAFRVELNEENIVSNQVK
jgi:hypothetical protein